MEFAAFLAKCRKDRRILLFIVYIALFLDNMLLTTVVPIIPEYLLRISHPNATAFLLYNKADQLDMENEKNDKREKRDITWDDARWEEPIKLSKNPRPFPPLEFKHPSGAWKEDEKQERNEKKHSLKELEQRRHEILTTENIYVGLIFGSKALIQVFTNPWIGPLTNRIGYTIPMFTGFCIMFVSTLMFAFGDSYFTLWFARALQGIGSACTSTSGMGMLAQTYTEDSERGNAMGIALGGLALGVLVGPPYGGVLYEWSGKALPFLLLALLALFDGSLQFFILQPKINHGEPEGTAIMELAKDPYILIAAGAITIGNLGIAMLEPSLPLWMMETWQAGAFERGAAFLPASISYLIGTNIFGPLAHKIGRWLCACLGIIIIGFCLLLIPSATSIGGLIVPNFCLGFSIGMIDASIFPEMGSLVDKRHVGVYGSIYAIADSAFCFAFAIGPFISGPLVSTLGFPTMLYIIAVISFIYAPLMLFLRNPPAIVRGDKKKLASMMTMTDYESMDYFAPEPPIPTMPQYDAWGDDY